MNTVISVRTNQNIKKAAQEVAQSVGIPLSTLINSYLKQLVATRKVELYAPEQMTPKLEKLVAEVEQELALGNVSKGFNTADDFLRDLKK